MSPHTPHPTSCFKMKSLLGLKPSGDFHHPWIKIQATACFSASQDAVPPLLALRPHWSLCSSKHKHHPSPPWGLALCFALPAAHTPFRIGSPGQLVSLSHSFMAIINNHLCLPTTEMEKDFICLNLCVSLVCKAVPGPQ